jgi:hypothetical protein
MWPATGVQGQGQAVLVVVVIAVTPALAELLARVDGCYLNKTDRQRRKKCLVCLGRRMVFGWLKMIHCLSCSSNSNYTGS